MIVSRKLGQIVILPEAGDAGQMSCVPDANYDHYQVTQPIACSNKCLNLLIILYKLKENG